MMAGKVSLKPSLRWLLVFIPISWIAYAAQQPVLEFASAGLGIVPLAGLLSESTEKLAAHVGARLGGLLNATLGNLPELIVALLLVRQGELEVVKASLIGSILGNLLLVLGIALVAGGWGRSEQSFNPRTAGVHSTSLALAVMALVLPAILVVTSPNLSSGDREGISVVVAAVLIAVYAAGLVFTQVTHSHLFASSPEPATEGWSRGRCLLWLGLAALGLGIESQILAGSLSRALLAVHLPALFVGLIVIPIIANAAEHSSAVYFAIRDRLELSLEVAIGSSTQMALFVAPVVVFLSLVLGHPMDFVFSTFEIATVALATLISALICLDGRTNWLEGVQLVGAYVMVAAAAFVLGAS